MQTKWPPELKIEKSLSNILWIACMLKLKIISPKCHSIIIRPSTEIAQPILFRWIKWPPELKIEPYTTSDSFFHIKKKISWQPKEIEKLPSMQWVKIESPFVNPVVSCGLPTHFGINVTNVRKVWDITGPNELYPYLPVFIGKLLNSLHAGKFSCFCCHLLTFVAVCWLLLPSADFFFATMGLDLFTGETPEASSTMRVLAGAHCSGTYLYFEMCKAWLQYNERPRALSSLNMSLAKFT